MSTDRWSRATPGDDASWSGSQSRDEHHTRLRRGVRELADAVPVPDVGPAGLRAAAARRRARQRPERRWLPAVAAAASTLVALAVGLLPPMLDRGAEPGADTDVAVLPKTFADHSNLTAHVSADPPGPAVAVYSYGQGDFPTRTAQVLVVGIDGRTYRQLDAAAGPGTGYAGSADSAATLLSPDGTKVAVGDSPDRVAVVDLVTGETRRYPVDGTARQFLAWSPDSRRLLYLALPRLPDGFEEPREGEPVLLDLASGSRTAIPGQRGTVDAAFSPDGLRLAFQRYGELRIVRSDGTVERTVPVPDRHRLAGAAAWSPDGTRLALYRMGESGIPGTPAPVYGLPGVGFPDGLAVLDLAGGGTRALDAPVNLRELLGWREDRMLVDYWDTIVQVPVAGGPAEPLSTLQPGDDHFIVDVQLATGLLPTVEVREADVDRGPWPVWLRLLVAAGALLTGWLALLLIRCRKAPARP